MSDKILNHIPNCGATYEDHICSLPTGHTEWHKCCWIGEWALENPLAHVSKPLDTVDRTALLEALESEPEHGWMLGIGPTNVDIKMEVMLKGRVVELVESTPSVSSAPLKNNVLIEALIEQVAVGDALLKAVRKRAQEESDARYQAR